MTARTVRHRETYGTPSYPVPLILGAQDGADSRRYWSTGETVRGGQEALRVAGKLLPSSCEAVAVARKFTGERGLTGKDDPREVWLVTVGLSDEGSDADKLAGIRNTHFGKFKP